VPGKSRTNTISELTVVGHRWSFLESGNLTMVNASLVDRCVAVGDETPDGSRYTSLPNGLLRPTETQRKHFLRLFTCDWKRRR
jgi:hypothetical protein